MQLARFAPHAALCPLLLGAASCQNETVTGHSQPSKAQAPGGSAESTPKIPAGSAAPTPKAPSDAAEPSPKATRFGLVLHGGAGTIDRATLDPDEEAEYRRTLTQALDAGFSVLDGGGHSIDAVEAAIVLLEDSPLFNAGRGAVFTHEGTHELDASIMDGATGNAGAVTGVRTFKNPILLARKVMTDSPHVMLAGTGAEAFGDVHGLERKPPEYFDTTLRRQQLEDAHKSDKTELDHGSQTPVDGKFGTVGAVALDRHGNLAAATSTGGMTNKRWGRVGDSPIIGAGTFAKNTTCAVSSTGHGEYFIREAAAHSVSARMEYGGQSLEQAARAVVFQQLEPIGGKGGVIAIDAQGNTAMPYNTPGMYRGLKLSDGTQGVFIWDD